jgi:hypothetical protein
MGWKISDEAVKAGDGLLQALTVTVKGFGSQEIGLDPLKIRLNSMLLP